MPMIILFLRNIDTQFRYSRNCVDSRCAVGDRKCGLLMELRAIIALAHFMH